MFIMLSNAINNSRRFDLIVQITDLKSKVNFRQKINPSSDSIKINFDLILTFNSYFVWHIEIYNVFFYHNQFGEMCRPFSKKITYTINFFTRRCSWTFVYRGKIYSGSLKMSGAAAYAALSHVHIIMFCSIFERLKKKKFRIFTRFSNDFIIYNYCAESSSQFTR